MSGQSGVGKTTIIGYLARFNGFKNFPSCTTRPKRTGELNDINYHFISEEMFFKYKNAGKLLDCVEISGYYYGFPFKDIIIAIKNNENCVVNLVPESGLLLKRFIPKAKLIYLTFPSPKSQIERLRNRGMTNYEISIRLRDDPNPRIKPLYYDLEIVNFKSKLTARKINKLIIENI